jgi:lipopolysaccharide assembly protein A
VQQRRKQPSLQEGAVKYVYIALIVALTALVLLFKLQNLQTVTVSLLSASFTMPVSVLLILIYVLGMLTGGFLFALVRTWIRGARRD